MVSTCVFRLRFRRFSSPSVTHRWNHSVQTFPVETAVSLLRLTRTPATTTTATIAAAPPPPPHISRLPAALPQARAAIEPSARISRLLDEFRVSDNPVLTSLSSANQLWSQFTLRSAPARQAREAGTGKRRSSARGCRLRVAASVVSGCRDHMCQTLISPRATA